MTTTWNQHVVLIRQRFVITPVLHDRYRRTVNTKKEIISTDNKLLEEIPGLRQVLNKDAPRLNRLLWLITSLTILSVCVYQIIDRVAFYLEDRSVVNTFYVSNKTIDFPSISFCPYPFFFKWESMIDAALKNKSLKIEKDSDINNLLGAGNITINEFMNATKLLWSKVEVEVYDPFSMLWQEYESFQINDLPTVKGLCHTIDPMKSLRNFGSETVMKVTWRDGQFQTWRFMGTVHPKDHLFWKYQNFELKSRSQHWHQLGPGKTTFRMEINQMLRRKTKINNCKNEKAVTKCLVACLKKSIVPSLSNICRLPVMEDIRKYPPCRSVAEMQNTQNKIAVATNSMRSGLCNCPKPCKEVEYDINQISDYPFPSTGLQGKYSVYIVLQDSVMLVNQELKGYTWMNLLCDVGGTLGLWLGLCGLEIAKITGKSLSTVFVHFSARRNQNQFSVARRPAPVEVINTNDSPIILFPGRYQMLKKRNDAVIRIIWLIIVVSSLGLCVYQIGERSSYYFSEPRITSVYYVSKEHILYPAISFCPESSSGLLSSVNLNMVREEFGKHAVLKLWNKSRIAVIDVSYSSENGYFAGVEVSEFPSVLGTCFTVKANHNLDLKDRFLWQMLCFSYENEPLHRIRMILHNPDDILVLKYLVKSRGNQIAASKEKVSHFSLKFVELNYLNSTKNPCSQRQVVNQCISKCIQSKIFSISESKCRLPYMPNTEDLHVCKTKSETEMMMNSTLKALNVFQLDDCKCPRYCTDVIYRTGSEFAIPNKKNEVCVKMTDHQERVPVMQQQLLYSLFSLYCDIGGAVGLLLGFCGLQLVELLIAALTKISTLHPFQRPGHFKERNIITFRKKTTTKKQQQVSNVEIPGFHEVMKKGSPVWIRILWLLISIAFMVTSVYQCAQQIKYYVNDPSEIVVFKNCTDKLFFPLVTFCPEYTGSFRNLTHDGYKILVEKWQEAKINVTEVLINNVPGMFKTNEIYTPRGICLILKIGEPVQVTNEKSIVATYSWPQFYRASVSALYPTDDYPRIQYGVNCVPLLITVDTRDAKFVEAVLQVAEINYRNTRQTPCTDGDTVAKCYARCIEKRIYSNVSKTCRLPFMQNSSAPPCETNEDWNNMMKKLYFFEKLPLDVPVACNCRRKCKLLWYSYNSFTSLFHAGVSHTVEGYVQFIVDIPDNCIYIIDEIAAYPIFKLLSDLGGIFGLYFGIGVLHIVEITAVFVQRMYGG